MPKTVHSKGYIALIRLIRSRRLELGLTQGEMAGKVHHGRTWLQKIETCQRRLDFLETVDLLRVLSIDLDDAARLVMGEAP